MNVEINQIFDSFLIIESVFLKNREIITSRNENIFQKFLPKNNNEKQFQKKRSKEKQSKKNKKNVFNKMFLTATDVVSIFINNQIENSNRQKPFDIVDEY